MTDFQHRILGVMRAREASGGLWLCTDDISHRLGYRPASSGRLACWNALQSLRVKGVVDYYRDRPDQWGVAMWGEL